MSTLAEVQRAALDLPDDERAILMARLWESLPGAEPDDDETRRRLTELQNDPATEISHEEFLIQVKRDRLPAR